MTPQAAGGEPVELRTADGTGLQGVLYRPPGRCGRAVLVAGGLGGLRLRQNTTPKSLFIFDFLVGVGFIYPLSYPHD